MDGFVSYKEDFEEDMKINRQPVEVDKKWRRREGTGDNVDSLAAMFWIRWSRAKSHEAEQ